MSAKEIKFDHFKDINDLLKNIDSWHREDDIEYTRWFGLEDLYNLKIYITNLQQKVEQLEKENEQLRTQVNTYENPDDLTLFYMWLDEQAKDKIKQLENIRKEAIEYINKNWGHWCSNHCKYATETINILNKGSDKE